jgi:putative transposase
MPSRTFPFVNGEYYHIYNRGVAKMPIFTNFFDYRRFTKSMIYYQIEGPKPKFSRFVPASVPLNEKNKIVEIVCYCLMSNHFHFLLMQKKDGGITEFVSKLSNSYTRYFNVKNKRVGPLLQGEFKSVYIESNEQLLHVSRYIHLNPLIGYLVKDLDWHRWSSYPEYIGIGNTEVCSKDIILDQFKSREDYRQFVLDQEDYGKQLEIVKHQLLDYEG